MPTLHLKISGKVQGVGYRVWLKQHAQQLALAGYVRNCDNGDVEATAVGPYVALQRLIAHSMQGPHYAKVDQVDYQIENDHVNIEGFHIRH